MTREQEELVAQLEALVDGSSLAAVLDALSFLCDLKRDHIMESWQDRNLAASWSRLARQIERAAVSAQKERL